MKGRVMQKNESTPMTDAVVMAWQRIVAWLQEQAPAALAQSQGPAAAQQLDAFATQVGLQLPADFCTFYQLLNGAEDSGIFPSTDDWDRMAYSPLSLAQAVQEWQMQKDLLEMGDFAGQKPKSAAGVADVWWHPAWLPFAGNGGGDYYCIDLAPTAAGVKGQIITHSHESGQHTVLAPSLAAYLSNLADALAAGTLVYDDDYGLCTNEE